MSKGISKIGRAFDKVVKATGARAVYDKLVPSKIRKAVSNTWQKIRKPVMVAAAVYLTAGLGAAAIGGTSIAGGFSTVNAGIASAFGGGAAGGATGAASTTGVGAASGGASGLGASASGGLLSGGATTGAAGATAATSASSVGAGAGGLLGAGSSAASTAAPKAMGFFGNIKAGNYAQAAVQGGQNVFGGMGKAWNAATANPGSAMLTASVLQGVGANQQQKRQDRRDEEFRNRRTWYGMDGQGGHQDFSQGPGLLSGIQAPQMNQSTSLDDLIKSRKQGGLT
ncbi:hypothetical protein [Aliidiomarina maris]|uniref:Uncharacterized protein n=1 Tax=Aliidiomarina maris TaxID=531312 RepID=A0A327X3B7_9GAMM|nr:hypothetical protein [Aliidiomarina maris]RAK01600.1 hypothetical protein B0I24_101223 [Aliidiomarina maris]RUO28426.1 hypothetical protein CWE07_01065 [Aliidiomarina maris]